MKTPKYIQLLMNDPRVDSIVEERADNNGWWVCLTPGYWDIESGISCLHERTMCDLKFRMDHYVERKQPLSTIRRRTGRRA